MEWSTPTRVLLYSQQPFVAHGLAAVLESRPDFELAACRDDWPGTVECLMADPPDVALVYLTPEISLSDLRELRSADPRTPVVLWGQALAGEFVFQAMQLGIRGLIPSQSPVEALLSTLKKIRGGELCFETEIMETLLFQKRVVLSQRESQLVALVAQGLKNKEIAASLGLSEGTVKVYLTRVFKKLDMNDRLDLALYGLKNFFAGQPGTQKAGETRADVACPRSLPLRSRGQAVPPLLH